MRLTALASTGITVTVLKLFVTGTSFAASSTAAEAARMANAQSCTRCGLVLKSGRACGSWGHSLN